jgi:glycogen debranching enzyme
VTRRTGVRRPGRPDRDDATLRPDQIFAASLPASPLSAERRRQVVDACARHLLACCGLGSLGAGEPRYTARHGGAPAERGGAYHQGAVWGRLLGPFALAHLRVYGDREAARAPLDPMGHHMNDRGLGSIGEIFDGDPPFALRGAICQAWSVAETLRAWCDIARGNRAAGLERRRGGRPARRPGQATP